MSKGQKRRHAAKKHGSKDIGGGLTRLDRERRALAKADPFRVSRPCRLPPPPSTDSLSAPSSVGGPVGASSDETLSAETSPVEAPPAMPGESSFEDAAEVEAFRKALGPRMGRVKLAMLAFAMAAMATVAIVRACERETVPVEDDAAVPGSCSDDAAMCVARG